MRKTLLTFLIALTAIPAVAQVRTPRTSPSSTLIQTVGLTDITIKYSRPGVRGRAIWGALVPYDAVWRTGANEATTITFSDEVTVEGQKLAKGTYAFFTIPGRDQWTLVFNKQGEQWGAFTHDATQDAARVQVKPMQAEFREWMQFEIPELTTDTAKVVLRWENVAVPFTVNTNTVAKTASALRNAMKPGWQLPYSAAAFAFDNKGAATDEEMNAWLEQSLAVNQNVSNLWLKARILQRAGKRDEAVKAAELAIAAARPDQKDFITEIRKGMSLWPK